MKTATADLLCMPSKKKKKKYVINLIHLHHNYWEDTVIVVYWSAELINRNKME